MVLRLLSLPVYRQRVLFGLFMNGLDALVRAAKREGAYDLGVMVVGAMCKDMFWASIPVAIGSGEDAQTLQDILDGIMPGMLGMIAFWLYYWLLSKKINPMVLIVATMVVGIIGAFFGVLA